ncbi:FecR domain-containing protein [Opitutus sp. GAS368]|jgi:transmembrane sensor|uniref:FecR family protein n=1 Tax=Opitutus sp. GAS368 TaxID=1882749 RepID=UPI00087A9A2E|nr:FecR domain-containing protein [Opitutus sp. GAS368]SDS25190.1 FecR family protein [Opitutus sp. GAS368]
MKPAHHPSALAEEQASLWAARLDGSALSAADRTALDTWLATDPVHRALLSSYCQFSADLEQQLPLLAGIRDELAESQTVAKTERALPWLSRPLWAGAALMAAAVLAAVFLWPARPQNQFQNLATPIAQRQSVTLIDGTRVELNAQTALVVELGGEARRVRLAAGEAFFHVSKDPARPFYVETPAGSVRVTGTQFNVRTDSHSALEVTVLEGSVQVRPGGGTPRALAAGDQLVRTADQVAVIPLSAGQLNNALAWRQGLTVFAGTPLREALGRFARYHGRSLNASDAAASHHVGGTYSLDDLDGFLAGLEDTMSLRVTRGLDGSIQVDVPDSSARP